MKCGQTIEQYLHVLLFPKCQCLNAYVIEERNKKDEGKKLHYKHVQCCIVWISSHWNRMRLF